MLCTILLEYRSDDSIEPLSDEQEFATGKYKRTV